MRFFYNIKKHKMKMQKRNIKCLPLHQHKMPAFDLFSIDAFPFSCELLAIDFKRKFVRFFDNPEDMDAVIYGKDFIFSGRTVTFR